jgi:hypothetical protein
MLPLGLLLIAYDVPVLRKPVGSSQLRDAAMGWVPPLGQPQMALTSLIDFFAPRPYTRSLGRSCSHGRQDKLHAG